MTNNQAHLVSDEQMIDAANERAKLYDDDDRQDIKTDVINAFYAGVKFALAPSIEADTAKQSTDQSNVSISAPDLNISSKLAQGAQAVNTLHEAIMNLPRDNRQSDEFKRGHRDARHAAAELVAQTQPPQQDSAAMSSDAQRLVYIEDNWFFKGTNDEWMFSFVEDTTFGNFPTLAEAIDQAIATSQPAGSAE